MKDPAQGQSPDYSHLWWTHGSPEGLSGGLMVPLGDSLVDSWLPWGGSLVDSCFDLLWGP